MIAVILGTRPEIIKMSPVIRALDYYGIENAIIHSGQHYSYNMDKLFFEKLNLPQPRFHLEVGSAPHGAQTGRILENIERVFLNHEFKAVLVQGDTNTVLAGAIAAAKLGVKVGHVEAGLRSYDSTMPEELNRTLTDHCSDFLFAPTLQAKKNLRREGCNNDRIFVTGNTIVDAVYQNIEIAKRRVGILDELNLDKRGYFLATVHRQENVDNKKRLRAIFAGLEALSEKFKKTVILPCHPRTRKRINEFGIDIESTNISLIEPLDYFSFLILENSALLVLTDSGGVQEETCVLKTPCITLRDNTERPETVKVGSNVVSGTEPEEVLKAANSMLKRPRTWKNPFGDGDTGMNIVKILKESEI